MHRHGYQGRKLQMAAGPRRALIRGQLTSLALHEAITTTEAKAKEVAPRFERLVTHAKKGTPAGGRLLRKELLTESATQKMLLELAPAFAERNGGYTRIIKLENRRGDNAPMVRLELVLNDIKPVELSSESKAKAKDKPKTAEKPKADSKAKAAADKKEAK